jgi:hypothetical protein
VVVGIVLCGVFGCIPVFFFFWSHIRPRGVLSNFGMLVIGAEYCITMTGLPFILHCTRSRMNNYDVFTTDLFGQHSYSGTHAKCLPGRYVRVPMFRVL